ncbi:cupin domain-containing protein [Actinocorallia lasiicapitis]
MSLFIPEFPVSVVVRAADAEAIGQASTTIRLLSGDQLVTAERGDLVIVPPSLTHAFAAAPGHDADLPIVVTPGVERFKYFRHLERVAYGEVPPESLLDVQELYDTYFQTSPTSNDAKGTR